MCKYFLYNRIDEFNDMDLARIHGFAGHFPHGNVQLPHKFKIDSTAVILIKVVLRNDIQFFQCSIFTTRTYLKYF